MFSLLVPIVLLLTPPPLVAADLRKVPLPTLGNPERASGSPFREDSSAEDTFRARCAMCHGEDGSGRGHSTGARNVISADWQDSRTDAEIRDAIVLGVADSRMRAFAGKGTPEQFDALVRLIRSMRAVLDPADAEDDEETTPEVPPML